MAAPKTSNTTGKPIYPGKRPEMEPDAIPEPPLDEKELLDLVPDEEEFIDTPDDNAPPGEGP